MEKKKIRAHVLSHTHWDREWYAAFETFRKRLLNLIDSLVENLPKNPHFKHFMLDGQTIVLEDYLELRPQKKDKLIELIREGKISVGPWYILPDEFLITGEALIRNFLIGKSVLDRLGANGNEMKIGYLPDMFGHNAYTPVVLRGLGFEGAVLWRGIGAKSRKTEFVWKAPNGDEIIAVNLIRSYSNGAHFGRSVDLMKNVFRNEIEELSKNATTENILIMNGTDHEFPLFNLPERFQEWSEEFGAEIIHSSLHEYLKDVKNQNPELEIVEGELKDPKYEPVLKDITSTRIFLKLMNFEAQLLYQRYLEPLSTLFCSEEDPLLDEIEYGWKLILKSQPHDSICGCSIDKVHKDVDLRLSNALEIGFETLGSYLKNLSNEKPLEDKKVLIVYNPYERERKAIVKGIVDLDPSKNYVVADEEGNIYETSVEPIDSLEVTDILQRVGDNDYLQGTSFITKYITAISPNVAFGVRPVRISFMAQLPAIGLKKFFIKESEITRSVEDVSTSFENKFYYFKLNEDGTFQVFDKQNKTLYEKMNFFEDVADAGDEYNFSPIPDDIAITSPKNVLIKGVKNRGFTKEIDLLVEYEVPEELTNDRKARFEKTVMVPIEVKYILFRDEPRIDVKLSVQNNAKDHKLMVGFHFPEKLDEVINDGYFGLVKHPTIVEPDESATEEVVPRYAMESLVSLLGEKGKLLITSRGLHEYETQMAENGLNLKLTLLRAIGWLSRDDLLTRKGHAGPGFPTPEAQCIGKYHYRYSLKFLNEGTPEEIYDASRKFLLDPVLLETSENVKTPEMSFFNLEDGIILSTFKISQNRDAVIARFLNVSDVPRKISFRKNVEIVNLAEEPTGEIISEFVLEPGKVLTVKSSK